MFKLFSGRDGQNLGHLVQPIQRFESLKFRENLPTLYGMPYFLTVACDRHNLCRFLESK